MNGNRVGREGENFTICKYKAHEGERERRNVELLFEYLNFYLFFSLTF